MSANRDHRDASYYSRGDRNLPPIREVFPDVLGGHVQANAYSFGDVRGALPASGMPSQQPSWGGYSGRGEEGGSATLPPIQHRSGHSSGTQNLSRGASTPSSLHTSGSSRDRGHADPGYSYGVLRTSGVSGALTDATPPSVRPQGILRQTAAPARDDPEDMNKRYKCDYCGKRFGMPSHLEIHIRTHTAQKPFACEWPGCDRTFSVRSNMMRHFRSHEKSTGSRQQVHENSPEDGDDYDTSGKYESTASTPSSRYFQAASTSSSSGQQPSYYSSSRRK